MKKLYFLLIVLLTANYSFAQTNTFPDSGNVGIGTVNPQEILHVIKEGSAGSYYRTDAVNGAPGMLTYRANGSTSSPTAVKVGDFIGLWGMRGYDGSGYINYSPAYIDGVASQDWNANSHGSYIALGTTSNDSVTAVERMRIDENGNVGIGTNTPATKLDIANGSIQVNNPGGYPFGINIDMNISTGWAREYGFSYNGSGKLFSFGAFGTGNVLTYGYIGGNITTNTTAYNTPWMVFLPSGNVGIGTKSPQSKLAVNGTITATEVKVTQTGWPDYVFSPRYKLDSLSAVVDYVHKNNHLPDMPSAKEIESKGLSLGDMEKKQMQKIEELTLYLIQAEKSINELKNQNEKLQGEMIEYKQTQTALEKEVNLLKNQSK